MSKPTTLVCMMCVAAHQNHTGAKLEGNPPKVKGAYVVYKGISMCKSHMIDLVNQEMVQAKSVITEVKGVPKISLT